MDKTKLSVEPTHRFTGRVEAYQRFRSRYPRETIPLLQERCGLTHKSVIADIGAGTGMLAELFLENGNRVVAVEPNAEMRAACEKLIERYPRLTCINATAEETGLPAASADFVTAGRALHWFDLEKCRREFSRIVRASGWIVFASLGPHRGSEPIAKDYQELLGEYGIDFALLRERFHLGDAVREFFAGGQFEEAEFPRAEAMTFEELEGYTVSLSVTPKPDHPRYPSMQKALREYFAHYESGGKLRLPMNCKLHFGQLG